MPLRSRLAALALTALLFPATALADIGDAERSMARDLTIQGNDLLKAHDYAGAADHFARADQLFRAASTPVPPTITLGLARSHAALGKLLSAQELYSKVAHETVPPNASPALISAVEDAKREMPAVAARLPGVVIDVSGSDAARVVIDGAEVPSATWGLRRPVDPGRHVIHASAPGFTSVEVAVTLPEGKTETVKLLLRPGSGGPPPPLPPSAPTPDKATAGGPTTLGPVAPPPPAGEAPSFWTGMRVGGVAAIGAGAVGIAVASVFGATAISKKNQSGNECGAAVGSSDPNACTASGAQLRSDGLSAAGIATGVFVAGAVVLAGGVTLMAVGGKKAPAARVGVGPGSIALSGRW